MFRFQNCFPAAPLRNGRGNLLVSILISSSPRFSGPFQLESGVKNLESESDVLRSYGELNTGMLDNQKVGLR